MRTIWLLALFSAFTLLFFSISTNQEYYTFPAWTPLLMLIAGALAGIEEASRGPEDGRSRCSQRMAHRRAGRLRRHRRLAAASPSARACGTSRNLPFVPDIGTLLAHRGVGDYTLSMSHFFDLTGPSSPRCACPPLSPPSPAHRPAAGWILRLRGKHLASTVSVALTTAVFLIAAHIAFARFEPMLSSKQMADTIIRRALPPTRSSSMASNPPALRSSFTRTDFSQAGLHRGGALLAPRQRHSLLWGSCYPDAPKIFFSDDEL